MLNLRCCCSGVVDDVVVMKLMWGKYFEHLPAMRAKCLHLGIIVTDTTQLHTSAHLIYYQLYIIQVLMNFTRTAFLWSSYIARTYNFFRFYIFTFSKQTRPETKPEVEGQKEAGKKAAILRQEARNHFHTHLTLIQQAGLVQNSGHTTRYTHTVPASYSLTLQQAIFIDTQRHTGTVYV